MGHGIKLTPDQWDELDRVRFRTPSADVFRNCLIILMSDSRDTVASIAKRLGCSTETVTRIRRLYRKGGVQALCPIKPPGRKPRATPEFIAQMKQAVGTSPQTLGYGFSVWSAARLAKHLAKVTGLSFSDDQMRRILVQHGYSFQRPKHTMKGKRDEVAYEKARKQLIRLKKTP
jgi:transposase